MPLVPAKAGTQYFAAIKKGPTGFPPALGMRIPASPIGRSAPLPRRQRGAQQLTRRLGAVYQPQSAAFDSPARGRADEVPAIGDHTMDVIAARAAMIGNLHGFADFLGVKICK